MPVQEAAAAYPHHELSVRAQAMLRYDRNLGANRVGVLVNSEEGVEARPPAFALETDPAGELYVDIRSNAIQVIRARLRDPVPGIVRLEQRAECSGCHRRFMPAC